MGDYDNFRKKMTKFLVCLSFVELKPKVADLFDHFVHVIALSQT